MSGETDKERRGKAFSTPWFLGGIAALLLAWELGSRWSGSPLIFPGPGLVLRRLWTLVQSPRFLASLGQSFIRVVVGIAISAPLGVLLGIASGLNRRIAALTRPLSQVISATPVMAVILIAFLWLGQDRTPVFTAFLMIFPVMSASSAAAVGAIDPRLRELFQVYPLSPGKKLRVFYIPAILPAILGGLRSSLSLCWKVVVAAEVLVQPFRALGTGMQMAKAQLEIPDLFAWTAATVIASGLSELLLSLAVSRYRPGRARC
jgi:NitT/TauT family transport system permease protein